MISITSAILVYCQSVTPELRTHIDSLRQELNKTRLRNYNSLQFWKVPNEDGVFNHKNTGNALHRATKHIGSYFTCPIFVSYDNTLPVKELMTAVEQIRYTDLGRFYYINLNTDGTYEITLFQNTNTSFKSFQDVELLDPASASRRSAT